MVGCLSGADGGRKPAVFSGRVAVPSTPECLVPHEARAGWKAVEAGGSSFSHETDLLLTRRGLCVPLRGTLLCTRVEGRAAGPGAPARGQARRPSVPSPRSVKPLALDETDDPLVLEKMVSDHRHRRTTVQGSGPFRD